MPAYRFSGAKLRAAREAAGLTREQVAARLDRSESIIVLYELDYRPPTLSKAAELAAVLGVHVEDFFETTESIPA